MTEGARKHPPLLREVKRRGKTVGFAKTRFGEKVYAHLEAKAVRGRGRSRIVAVEDTYLTNVPIGQRRPPAHEDWQGHLFCRRADGRRTVVTLRGATKAALRDQIAAFASLRGVKLLE